MALRNNVGRSQVRTGLRNAFGRKYPSNAGLMSREIAALIIRNKMGILLPLWPHHTTTATAIAPTPALLFSTPLYLWPFNNRRICSCDLCRHSPRRLRPKSPTTAPAAITTTRRSGHRWRTGSISCCYGGSSQVWRKSSCDECGCVSKSYVLGNGLCDEQEQLLLRRTRPLSPAIDGARTLRCTTLSTRLDDRFATRDKSPLSTVVDGSSAAVDDTHTIYPSYNRAEFLRLLLAAGAVLAAAGSASSPKGAAATVAQVDNVAPDEEGRAQECGRSSALRGEVADDSDDRNAT